MFPVTRDVLIYVLGLLVAIMAILLILILRRRVPLSVFSRNEKKEPTSLIDEQPDGGAYTRTGPIDLKSIKDKLLGERKPKTAEAPEKPVQEELPEPSPPPESPPKRVPPEDVQAPPPEYKEPETVPEPPYEPTPEEESNEPFLKEGVVEEGIELHDHPEELEREEYEKYGPREEQPVRKAAPPQPEPLPKHAPAPQAPPKSDDYFILDEAEHDKESPPVQKTAPKTVKRKDLIARGIEKPQKDIVTARPVPRQQPRQIEALKPGTSGDQAKFSFKKVEGVKTGAPVESAEIAKDPKSFIGQSVSVEGELHLSSKGDEDAWYVLFDKSGSSIVRSREEIPLNRCRITAKVQKTKLGQIYLDAIRYEPV